MRRSLLTMLLTLTVTTNPAINGTVDLGTEHHQETAGRGEARLTVLDASPDQWLRLQSALERFERAGLILPHLVVSFHDDREACGGHHGLFQPAFDPWLISICDDGIDAVYEHELAHAWERATLTDDVRQAFMEARGSTSWADHSTPWNQRGVEGVAFVIQQGLGGSPLPPVLSPEHRSRLNAFELLTGRPAPRLIEWTVASAGA